MTCELRKFCDLAADLAVLRAANNANAPAGAHLQKAFVSEGAKGPQDRVGVHPYHGCEVVGGWETVARFGLALCDGAAYRRRHLVVKMGWLAAINVDLDQCAK